MPARPDDEPHLSVVSAVQSMLALSVTFVVIVVPQAIVAALAGAAVAVIMPMARAPLPPLP